MDKKRRIQLIKEIIKQEWPPGEGPCPLVTLEAFFEGNDDKGSIGCNLEKHPGISSFYEILRSIRSKENVQDVLVEIYEVDEDDESTWTFSERIYLITSANQDEVEEWMKTLNPDEIGNGFTFGTPKNAPVIKSGMSVYSAWWD
jgi:hypothetical protein